METEVGKLVRRRGGWEWQLGTNLLPHLFFHWSRNTKRVEDHWCGGQSSTGIGQRISGTRCQLVMELMVQAWILYKLPYIQRYLLAALPLPSSQLLYLAILTPVTFLLAYITPNHPQVSKDSSNDFSLCYHLCVESPQNTCRTVCHSPHSYPL